jgi:hypothetical protein
MNKGIISLLSAAITGISSLIFFTFVGFSLSTSSSDGRGGGEYPTVSGGNGVATIVLTIVFAIVVFFICRIILGALFNGSNDQTEPSNPTSVVPDAIVPSSSLSADDKKLLFSSPQEKLDLIKYLSLAGGVVVAAMDLLMLVASLFLLFSKSQSAGPEGLAVIVILPFALVDLIVSTVFLVATLKGKRSALKPYLIYTFVKALLPIVLGPLVVVSLSIFALPLVLLVIAFVKLRKEALQERPEVAVSEPPTQPSH